jgi:hypothetical protein
LIALVSLRPPQRRAEAAERLDQEQLAFELEAA